jgi:hypothetical protein
MKLRRKKTKPEELLESLSHSVNTLGDSVGKNKVAKVGMITGGAAALTAVSSAVSSLRRHIEGGA